MIKKLLLFITTLGCTLTVMSQGLPVQTYIHIIPPYSLQLSDYSAPGTGKLNVSVRLADPDKPDFRAKLKITIEGNGFSISTSPYYFPQPITLQGGVLQMLSGSDLEAYLNPSNLIFNGLDKTQFARTGKLPEGIYRFSVQVLDYNRGTLVSNTGMATAWLILNDPPILNLPFPNEKVRATEPQNIIFQWTPRHTASPNSAFSAKYLFELWEIWPEGRDPNVIAMSSNPIYQTETYSTTLIYSMMEPTLEPGRSYAYRVKAFDTQGLDLFKNNGYSVVQKFTFGEECKLPLKIEAGPLNENSVKISWDANFGHSQFIIKYKEKNVPGAEWFTEETYMTSITLHELKPATEYEYQVKGMCGTVNGDFSGTYTVRTLEKELDAFECGDADKIVIENTTLINSLSVNDYINAGGFMVRLTEIKKVGGGYTGKGEIAIPFLDRLRFNTEFTNIKINEAKQLFEGKIDVTGATADVLTEAQQVQLDAIVEDIEDIINITDNLIVEVLEQYQESLDQATEIAILLNNVIENFDDVAEAGKELIEEKVQEFLETGEFNITEAEIRQVLGTSFGPESESGQTTYTNDSIKNKARVWFTTIEPVNYGFDAPDPNLTTLAKYYENMKINGGPYPVAWKSMEEAGASDKIKASIEVEKKSDIAYEIKFESNAGTPPAVTGEGNEKEIILNAQPDGTIEEIMAMYTEKGSDGKTQEIPAGKIKVKSYQKIYKKLMIVPVNGNETNTAGIVPEINKMYKPAIMEWQQVQGPANVTVDLGTGPFDDGEAGMLSNYTPDMNKVISAFKDVKDIDGECYYLFLVKTPASGNKLGQMPLKRQFGFIFTDVTGPGDKLNLTMAHELAHGAFRLSHPFQEEPVLSDPQNLMDYNNGTTLRKYQWDYVHDPVAMLAWDQDEEEGALAKASFPEVEFFKQTTQRYGFDKNDIKTVTDYNKKNIFDGNTFEVPWQMVRLNFTGSDNTINVKVKTKKSETCSKLFLVPENEIITDGFKPIPASAVQIIGTNQLNLTPNNTSTHNISVMGMGNGSSGFKVVKDSLKGDLIGALNIYTAEERVQNVYVVTVHLNKTSIADTSAVEADLKKGSSHLSSYITPAELGTISTIANEIYNQTLLNVNFTLFNTAMHKFTNAICLNFDIDNDGKIDATNTTGFTAEQTNTISEFEKYYNAYITVNDKVLFIVDNPAFPSAFASNQFVLGIMKRNQKYGFIYKNIIKSEGKNLERVISHELGHGFNLLHPEQSPSLGSSAVNNNIMNADIDNTGKELIFYQWLQLLKVGR